MCAWAVPSRGGRRGGLAESCRVGPWTRVLLSGGHRRRPSVHIRSGGRDRQGECAAATGRRWRTRGVRAQASPTGRPAGHVSATIRRAAFEDSWRRHPDGRGSRVHISPLADRARSLRDESVGCDDRGVTLMWPEALSEGGIDAGRPSALCTARESQLGALRASIRQRVTP